MARGQGKIIVWVRNSELKLQGKVRGFQTASGLQRAAQAHGVNSSALLSAVNSCSQISDRHSALDRS